MSTSLLRNCLGIYGYDYIRTDYDKTMTTFTIAHRRENLKCSCCGTSNVVGAGKVTRIFRSVPIGSKPTQIKLDVQRLRCHDCGKTRQAKLGFANENSRHTKFFERYVLELSQYTTILDVALHLNINWDTVKNIQKNRFKQRFKHIPLRSLKHIAIDEISVGKNHSYLTVVLDLDSGAVVFVGKGKGSDSLKPFWTKLRRSQAKIEAVATDMSPAYLFAISDNIPDAIHVLDHFHVIKLFNEKLSALRRAIQNSANDQQKKIIKGTRWLLLKGKEKLNDEKDENNRLQRALEINQPLYTAYYLKEDLRQLWKQGSKGAAEKFLDSWVAKASSSGVAMLKKFAITVLQHRQGLLAWYDYNITTGPLEGLNNKIKTMQRQAYGYRDKEFFKLKLFAIHEAKYALTG